MTTAMPDRLRARLASIAHGAHPIPVPLMASSVETIIPLLGIEYGARVLDLGCGGGEWLIRLIDRIGCTGEGVDLSEEMIAAARLQAEYRLVDPQQLVLRAADPATLQSTTPYDAVLCCGSIGDDGDPGAALALIKALLRPEGRALVSVRFWERPPSDAARHELGGGADLLDLAGTLDRLQAAAFIPLFWHVSSPQEWDDYESMRAGSVERFAQEHPDDEDVVALLELARRQREVYLTSHRASLGQLTCIVSAPRG